MAVATHSAPGSDRWLPAIDRTVTVTLHLFVFALPLLFYASGSVRIFEFAKLRWLYLAAVIVAAGWALRVLRQRRLVWYRTPLDLPLVAYTAALAIATALSTNVPRSLWGRPATPGSALAPTVACVVLYFGYVAFMRTRDALHRNAVCLAAGGVIAAGYGVMQHYGLDWINVDELGKLRDRAIGTIGNADPQGWYVALLFPLLTWLYLQSRKAAKGVIGVAWCVLVLGLLSTWSRSAFLGAIAGGLGFVRLLLAIRSRRGGQSLVPLVTLTVLALASSAFFLMEGRASSRFAGRVSVEGVQSGGSERFPLWSDTIEIWQRYPVWGSGPETFGEQQSVVREPGMHRNPLTTFNHAHNQYLQVLATSGAVGFVAYLWVIGAFLAVVVRLIRGVLVGPRRFSPLTLSTWPLATAAAFVSILVSQNFNPDFLPTTVLFFVLPAMTFCWQSLREQAPVRAIAVEVRPWVKWISVSAVCLLVLYAVEFNARMWQAHVDYRRALELLTRNRVPEAEALIDRAVAANGSDADFWWVRAQTYAVAAVELRQAGAGADVVQAAERVALLSSERSVALDPTREDLWRQRAFCLRDLAPLNPAHVQEAIAAIKEAITRFPNSGLNYLHLSRLHKQAGDVEAAIRALESATQVAPEMALPHAELAMLRYQRGNVAAAGPEVDAYLGMRPGPPQWDVLTQLRTEADKAGDAARTRAIDDRLRALSLPAQRPGKQ